MNRTVRKEDVWRMNKQEKNFKIKRTDISVRNAWKTAGIIMNEKERKKERITY